ncbi:MAG: ribonuclease D [Haliscomenobacteraceae bacterium CHB4]|nr:Ribonuclease D [Saprospiraceae bacterium]MCE7923243.1 ribonuclease D [Haliscomenobacteraceae bacterium CHB4]
MNQRTHFLEKQQDFDRVLDAMADAAWIGFDTEFVGEKTYVPVLCLIQIVTNNDIYLIDTLRIKDLRKFLDIVADPKVLKITHAGDNDYRLLNILFGTVPQNTFDTQIAAGLVGYNYPAGFAKIVERELRVSLAKSHTVADWEARPLDPKALDYAVEDVKYLPALHEKLTRKLARHSRESWAREENRKWETPDFYAVDPNKELLANDFVHQLGFHEKVFLMRLYRWRVERAIELNIPKEQVLQSRFVSTVLRATKDGPGAFRANRTLPENVWKKNLDTWQELWRRKANDEEKEFLESLPKPKPEDPEREWTMELLYHFVKKQCLEHEISAALLLPKGDFNRLKAGSDDFDHSLLSGWRFELLGAELVEWLTKGGKIEVEWKEGYCKLTM